MLYKYSMHVDCFPHCQKSRCLSLWEKNRHLTHNDKKLDLKTFRYQLEYTAIMLQCTLTNLRGRWQENNSSGINILGVHCTNINHELVICRTVILLKSALSFGHTQWSLIGLSQEKNKKIVGYFDLFGMAFVFFGQIYLVPLLCVCVCLSLHLLGWAHSLWRFLGPRLELLFSNLNWNLLGRIVRTQPNMNFSTT